MYQAQRKSHRLKDYDYSSAGAYFLTVCTHNRKKLFSEIVTMAGDKILKPSDAEGLINELYETKLTDFGKVAEEIIKSLSERFEVEISDYVIMPNHIHMVVFVDEERAIRESPLQIRSLISKIIGYFKMNVSKAIHKTHPDLVVWQRDYYDRVIRDDEEYIGIAEYIFANPGKWSEDKLYIK